MPPPHPPRNPQWDQVTWWELHPLLEDLRLQLSRDLELKMANSLQEYHQKWYKLWALRWLQDQADQLAQQVLKANSKIKEKQNV